MPRYYNNGVRAEWKLHTNTSSACFANTPVLDLSWTAGQTYAPVTASNVTDWTGAYVWASNATTANVTAPSAGTIRWQLPAQWPTAQIEQGLREMIAQAHANGLPEWYTPLEDLRHADIPRLIETPVQRAARLEIAQQEIDASNLRRAQLRREREKAIERAEVLLIEHLSPAQQEELRLSGAFHVHVTAPNGERRRYRIRRGRHGNIDQVDEHGNPLRVLCVHPTLEVPDADTMLAQMLHLRFNEGELLRVANITERRRAAA